MQHRQALELLSGHQWDHSEKQVWADLGCGSGTFTLALAHYLTAGSRITAIDKNPGSLRNIPGSFQNVTIEKRVDDFTRKGFHSTVLDGILMANSLHFVKRQKRFIKKLNRILKPAGTICIVEYDMDSSNPWVPYPITYDRLKKICNKLGYSSIQKITERPSRYKRRNLYTAIIHR